MTVICATKVSEQTDDLLRAICDLFFSEVEDHGLISDRIWSIAMHFVFLNPFWPIQLPYFFPWITSFSATYVPVYIYIRFFRWMEWQIVNTRRNLQKEGGTFIQLTRDMEGRAQMCGQSFLLRERWFDFHILELEFTQLQSFLRHIFSSTLCRECCGPFVPQSQSTVHSSCSLHCGRHCISRTKLSSTIV